MNNPNNGSVDKATGGYIAGWHSLGLRGARNARDAGGYITQDGHIMESGKLYRSNNLQNITASDDKILADHNIKTIIDLRSSVEDALFPDQNVPGARMIHQDIMGSLIPFEGTLTTIAHMAHEVVAGVSHIPFVHAGVTSLEKSTSRNSNMTETLSLGSEAIQAIEAPIKAVAAVIKNDFMDGMYAQFVDNSAVRQELGSTIKDIAQYTKDGQAVLIHCSAGKDRTGWVSALVQSEVGVDPLTVRRDYLTSTSNGFPVVNQYIDTALHEVQKHYGTIDNYVHQGLGVSDQDISQLKVSLLD